MHRAHDRTWSIGTGRHRLGFDGVRHWFASPRAAVSFLLDEAGFITGQNLNVCGGMTVGAAPL